MLETEDYKVVLTYILVST